MPKLTKRVVDAAKPQETDYMLWDEDMPGYGLRVFKTGRKSYLVQYRAGGRTRRHTFAKHGTMTADEARKHARELLVDVNKGGNPSEEKRVYSQAPTVSALCDRFMEAHVKYNCKPRTQSEYQRSVDLFIKPSLGNHKIGDVVRSDISRLHHKHKDIPYQANRTLGVLSKLFNLAEEWGLRPDGSNPCRHVKKYPEMKRQRFLSAEELGRLGQALDTSLHDETESPYVIAAFKLLILTGCRLGEIQTLKWDYVKDDHFALPDSKTGAKKIYPGAVSIEIVKSIEKQDGNPFVICGSIEGQHVSDMQKPWRRIRSKAELEDVRIHDLRHTFASGALSIGESLPTIGKLLGHTQVQTTARYAHLADAPMHSAADRVSESIAKALHFENPHCDKEVL